MLREALEDGPNNHDQRACHDRPTSTKALVEPRSDRNSKNGTELVARRDESKEGGLDGGLTIVIHIAVAEIC